MAESPQRDLDKKARTRSRARHDLLQFDPAVLKAYGHATWQKIILALDEGGQLSPSQIAKQTGDPLANISYHVLTLHKAEVIELVGTRPVRGALEHLYQLAELGERVSGPPGHESR